MTTKHEQRRYYRVWRRGSLKGVIPVKNRGRRAHEFGRPYMLCRGSHVCLGGVGRYGLSIETVERILDDDELVRRIVQEFPT